MQQTFGEKMEAIEHKQLDESLEHKDLGELIEYSMHIMEPSKHSHQTSVNKE